MKFQQVRGATVIVAFGGKRFLIAPFFAGKGTVPPIPSPYNNSHNPLVELPVTINKLVAVDTVVVTHMHHFDHFGEAARGALPKNMPMFVQNEGEADETPILMGTDGLYEVVKAAPAAVIVASHLDAVNHARVRRKELRQFVNENNITKRVHIPEDSEVMSF